MGNKNSSRNPSNNSYSYSSLVVTKYAKNGIAIEVLQGDVTDESTDAIVIANPYFDKFKCKISKAILKRGGHSIKSEFKQLSNYKGIGVITSSGTKSLLCKYIVHVNELLFDSDKIIKTAIKLAREKGLLSLSVPLIKPNYYKDKDSISKVALKITDALISAASNDECGSVKYVRLVGNSAIEREAFEEAMKVSINKTATELNNGNLLTSSISTPNLVSADVGTNAIVIEDGARRASDVSSIVVEPQSTNLNTFKSASASDVAHVIFVNDASMGQVIINANEPSTQPHGVLIVPKPNPPASAFVFCSPPISYNPSSVGNYDYPAPSPSNPNVASPLLLNMMPGNYPTLFGPPQMSIPASLNYNSYPSNEQFDYNCSENLLPLSWAPMNTNKPSQQVEIWQSDSDYSDAQSLFMLSGRTVHHIYRIQNPYLYKQFMAEKAKLENLYAGQWMYRSSIEWILYHGTDSGTLAKINGNGFDRSYCGKNATKYGQGSYFARDMNYSARHEYSPPDGAGHKWIYAARVLVGLYCQGSENIQHPPNQPNGYPYDTTVDDINNPSIFVIFRDARAYPLYLYEFC